MNSSPIAINLITAIVIVLQILALLNIMLGMYKISFTFTSTGPQEPKPGEFWKTLLLFGIAVLCITLGFYTKKIFHVPDKYWCQYWAQQFMQWLSTKLSK